MFWLKRHRVVKVRNATEIANAESTTSTLLSLLPLLGGNRSHSRTQVSPWSETPASRVDLEAPARADTASPNTSAQVTATNISGRQTLSAMPVLASNHSHTPPVARQSSTQPPNEPSSQRRPPASPISNTAAAAVAACNSTAAPQRKPPLHPQPEDSRPTSGSPSHSSTMTGNTGSPQFQPLGAPDPQHSEDHGSPSHQAPQTNEVEPPGGGAERPATPPPAYEPEAEALRQRERRGPRQETPKADQERLRVVQN